MHEKLKKQLRQSRLNISNPPNAEEWQRFLAQLDEDYVNKSSGQHTRILHRQLDETLLLNRVIAATTSSYKTNAILQIICKEFVQAFDLSRSTAAIFNSKQSELTIVAEYLRDDSELSTIGNKIPVANNPSTQHILRTRKPLVSNNVLEDSRLATTRHIAEKNNTRAMILLPLMTRDQILGTIGLNATEIREFTEEEQRLANSVAAATSQALENARLYEALQRRLRDQERADRLLRHQYAYMGALQETILTLINHLDLDTLVNDIVRRASILLNSKHGFLYLQDEQTESLILRAGCGAFEFSTGKKLIPAQGLGGATIENDQMVIVRDYSKRYGTVETESRLYGAAGVPLRSSNGVIGILGFAHLAEDRIFNEQEISMLESFAQFASIALDNAILHTAAKQAIAQHDSVKTERTTHFQTPSHEITTLHQINQALEAPLKGIITHSESLMVEAGSHTPPSASRWKQELGAIRDSGNSLLKRMSALIDLHDLAYGNIKIDLEWINIRTIINQAYQEVKPRVKQQKNTFTARISPTLGMVYIDADKVRHILINILENASMFTRDGEIHLRARQAEHENGSFIVIEIEDTAVGISQEHLNQVLGTQNPLQSARERAAEGVSFGLILSRYYSQLMRGNIEAQIASTQGTLFTIYLSATLATQAPSETILQTNVVKSS